jgi:predicted RNase H-like nuclease (RuvC/YqgF family)
MSDTTCPHIRSSGEGTQYCALAQLTTETIDALRKEIDELKRRIQSIAKERDRYRHALERLEHFEHSDYVRNIVHTALYLK